MTDSTPASVPSEQPTDPPALAAPRQHRWHEEPGGWSCACGVICDHEEPCGRHGECKIGQRRESRSVNEMLDQMDFYLRCIKPARPEHLSASLAWLHVAENALREAFERLPI